MSTTSERQTLLEHLLAELQGAITDARSGERTQPAAVAALSKELRAVRAELDLLNLTGEVSPADEIAARRAARRSTPADSASTSRRGQPRRGSGSNRTG